MSGTLVCDFDGTLINKNSEYEFLRFLNAKKRIGAGRWLLAALTLPVNRLSRAFGGNDVLRAWSVFRSERETAELMDAFLREENEIRLNQEVAELARGFPGRRILMTGSDRRLVEKLLVKLGAAELFHVVEGAETGKNGFVLKRHPYGKSKRKLLPPDCELGIGNEYADRFFLRACGRAFVVDPKENLRELAMREGWTILEGKER